MSFRLTFDDGPSEWTAAILDVLLEHDAKAMFFVTGQHIHAHPGTLRRAHAEGHLIGNHGHNHRRLTTLTERDVRVELKTTSRLIERCTGVAPTLWRAPYFDTNERINAIAASLGLTEVRASIVPDDWASVDPVAISRIVLDELKEGSVVSLHDGIPPDGGSSSCTASRQTTVDAVRLILEGIAVPA